MAASPVVLQFYPFAQGTTAPFGPPAVFSAVADGGVANGMFCRATKALIQ